MAKITAIYDVPDGDYCTVEESVVIDGETIRDWNHCRFRTRALIENGRCKVKCNLFGVLVQDCEVCETEIFPEELPRKCLTCIARTLVEKGGRE